MITEILTITSDLRIIATMGRDIVRDLRAIGTALLESDYDEARRIVASVESSKAAGKAAWLASKQVGRKK